MSTKRITRILAACLLAVVMTLIAVEVLGGPGTGPGPGGRGSAPRRDGYMAPSSQSTFMNQAPLAKDETEKTILSVLDDLDKKQRRGNMNISLDDGRLFRVLTESLNAQTVVEIGTSNGYSGIWFCLALKSTGGKLITHEIDKNRAALARENFKRAGVDSLITLVEGDAHQEVTKLKGPIDILFLDADKDGYLDYLEKLLPLVRPGGLIIAHNMTPRMADPKYVEAITTNPNLETILLHRETTGVSVSMKKR